MKVLILAAGFGTRLYPLTLDKPKPLLSINNKPLIEYTIEKLNKIDQVKDIYILTNSKFYINFLEWLEEFKSNNKTDKKIKIINNGVNKTEERKGAIGDIKYFLDLFDLENLIIIAGDNIFDFDLNVLIDKSKEKKSSIAALKIIENEELIKKYSCVLLDNEKRVICFKEKPREPLSNICSIACYVIKKQDLDKIKKNNFENADNLGNIIDFLYKNSDIYGEILEEFWCDIGSLEELKKAEKYFQKPF